MELIASLRKNTLGISIFAIVTAGLIAVTQVLTKDTITENRRQEEASALYQIIPQANIDNDLLSSKIHIPAPELGYDNAGVYQALKDGKVTAVILPVIAPDGYSGNISLIVGVNADASVAGVRVLAHQETPGLGDKIDLKKSPWILSFNGKQFTGAIDSEWAVKKDGGQFDQFTGATITPRAVVSAVGRALQFFELNRDELLAPTTGSTATQAPREDAS
ncbi:electron transport complex subunit RsxG [Neptunomonas phycophila]|uniref:electron transport complex subunit RsxG n=1 Tax=Neptunomonas TaxID=75687 RepID=UPI000948BB72|nr:electron transport complex subunit RsxG [Neptunomonas phycophila]QLE97067.1 electron transport complex subunit RsxG [Neptunomonas phycophila]